MADLTLQQWFDWVELNVEEPMYCEILYLPHFVCKEEGWQVRVKVKGGHDRWGGKAPTIPEAMNKLYSSVHGPRGDVPGLTKAERRVRRLLEQWFREV